VDVRRKAGIVPGGDPPVEDISAFGIRLFVLKLMLAETTHRQENSFSMICFKP
jgi:hypothetical protein